VIQLVEGGVSTVDALAIATSIAAEPCGVADRKGRIAAGVDADLLVVEDDPLNDITALRNVQAVFVCGVTATCDPPDQVMVSKPRRPGRRFANNIDRGVRSALGVFSRRRSVDPGVRAVRGQAWERLALAISRCLGIPIWR
jgi:hypothetical protein